MKDPRLVKIGIVIVAALAAVAMVPLYLVMSHTVQSTSITCQRCHPEPYATWKASREHPVSIACRQCHAGHPDARSMPPGFLADDRQVNAHCLSCHRDVTELVDVKRKLIKVSHRRHLDEGLGCLECHRYIAHAGPVYQGNRPPKKACYPCHVLQIDGSSEDAACRMCHHIILTTPGGVSLGLPVTVEARVPEGRD